jgi:serine/threonine protein kinase
MFPLPGGWKRMAFDRWSDTGIVADLDDVLLPGTVLHGGQYLIRSFLCSGGFGNAYLASDPHNRAVVLKECFVPELCRRHQGKVVPRSETHRQHMAKVIRSFQDEAALLPTLSHLNIVRAHKSFEENGTVYVVMDYIKGRDLLELIDDPKFSLTSQGIVTLARKLVSALTHIHDRGVLHCDVSPDNICLRNDGDPVLIDFGSARKCVNGVGQPNAGISMVKDGYSPHELYTSTAACGPYSDIYALGATLYHAVTGKAPVDCQTRRTALVEGCPDPLQPLAGSVAGYPPGFLASIDTAMSVRTAARHASARDWLVALARPSFARPEDIVLLGSIVAPQAPAGHPGLHA